MAGAVLLSGGTQALMARGVSAAPGRRAHAPNNGGYGTLGPVRDMTTGLPLLHLPEGFSYASFGHAAAYAEMLGLSTTGSDGFPTPDRHDGMATVGFAGSATRIRLVRNHERGYRTVPFEGGGEEPLIGNPASAYDRTAGGGTTTLTFDTARMSLVNSFISINGTSVNCAGGPTPQRSWLTCEETVNGTFPQIIDAEGEDNGGGFERNHGYVFEVPAFGGVVENPVPLKAMGRFAHEATAVDPNSGFVYLTEDSGNRSGFYRFRPENPGDLAAGGTLEMLAIKGTPQFLTYTGVSDRVGSPFPVEWVSILEPDPMIDNNGDNASGRSAVFLQGFEQGCAAFGRLEGCWYDGGSIFFNATSGGDAELGQVWEFRPRGRSGGQLILLFESPSADVLDAPDNLTVSPRGGLVLCEDGSDEQFVRGLDDRGQIFDFALNNISENRDKEFTGACYSPDGDVLFVNIQTPGVSFAIRGPFSRGAL
ncbi:MAG TPA: alkaline phosphatase PhoX [Pseudonocardiaceae bacterium]|jgi:secreted PhoX family phosphatase|nr:alkaline phosphatase PhoX [Pseudonocardiaceae bacterium]